MLKKSLAAAGVLAALSLTAHAAHNGAGGAHMGGMAAQHMSGEGFKNTNGPSAGDRDKGLARAEDRRNAEATAHEQAGDTQKGHKPSKGKSR